MTADSSSSGTTTSLRGRLVVGGITLAKLAFYAFRGKLVAYLSIPLAASAGAWQWASRRKVDARAEAVAHTTAPPSGTGGPPGTPVTSTPQAVSSSLRLMAGGALVGSSIIAWKVWRRRRPLPPPPLRRKTSRAVMVEEAARRFRAAGAGALEPSSAETPVEPQHGSDRFTAEPRALIFGRPQDAALGVAHYMCVPLNSLPLSDGVAAIEREVHTHGTPTDQECLHYILHESAGSSPRVFQDGLKRDCGPDGAVLPSRRAGDGGGMRLSDFVAHPHSVAAHLEPAHVVALRLYSSAAYSSLNRPLRDVRRYDAREPHRMPATVTFIDQARRAAAARAPLPRSARVSPTPDFCSPPSAPSPSAPSPSCRRELALLGLPLTPSSSAARRIGAGHPPAARGGCAAAGRQRGAPPLPRPQERARAARVPRAGRLGAGANLAWQELS